MAGRHWSSDELVSRLYGVGPEDSHPDECPECAERWRRLLAARARVLAPPFVPEEFLAAQRKAIYARLEDAPEHTWTFAFGPGLAVAAMVLLGLLVAGPKPQQQQTLASSDAQFFSEVYSVVQSTEPSAVAPIHGLFEVEQ